MYEKIGLQLYTVRNHMEDLEGVRYTFKRLAEIGYTEAQTAGMPCDVKDFAVAAEENGIKIIGTHCDFPTDINNLDDYVAMHRTLGTTNAGVGGGNYGETKESLMAYIDRVNYLAEKLAGYGMKFTYHHHSYEFGKIAGTRIIDYMIDGFDKKNVTFVLDTYWLNNAGCDVNAWIKKLAGRVDIIHLKDKFVPFNSNEGCITEIGSGNIDFGPIIKTAEEIGVKHLCVEQDVWPLGFDSIDCAEKSYNYLANLLKL